MMVSSFRKKGFIALLFFTAFVAVPCIPYAQGGGVIRFTLAAGANYGGKGRETLRYAISDARLILECSSHNGRCL